MAKMKKILGLAMAAVLCTASVMPAMAEAVPEVKEENGLTITTTTEVTKEGGNTVTVTIEEWNNANDPEATATIEGEQTTTETENKKKEKTVVDGEETTTEVFVEEEEEETYPEAEVELVPGETTVGEAVTNVEVIDNLEGKGNANNTDVTTVTDIERTVTAETSEVETTVNETDTGLLKDAEVVLNGPAPVYDEDDDLHINSKNGQPLDKVNGEHVGKEDVFDRNYLSSDSKYNDPTKWDMPEDADFRYIGTGEHSKFYNARVTVIYQKDEEGNTVYDEEGNPVIESIVKANGTVITIDGVPATELPEDVSLEPIFDDYNGGRPTTFMLMDENGNRVYAYCCDMETGAAKGTWYKVQNLEDSDYYGSEESEEHIRTIAMNGYWGTTDVPNEDGSYEMGSLEGMKQKLREAIESGEYENTTIEMPAVDADGNPVVDEAGNPVMESKTMLELIDDLSEGEALLATQSAIWAYSNGHVGALNGKDGVVVIDPDGYKWNHNPTSDSKDGEAMDDYGSARVDFLYTWLINLEGEEESTTIINDKNFVEDMSLVVKDKVEDHEDNADENKDNDVYNTEIKFTLAFVPDPESDDLLVYLADKDGAPLKDANGDPIIRRLAGEAGEGGYESIKPEEDGSYVLTGLQLQENSDFTFDLRLEGTQYLENGVYVYQAIGGRDQSQTFVGVAEGERNVDVSMGMTITFDVDENDKVVAERVWHKAASRSKSTGRTNDPSTTEINDEGVPMAASADGLVEILDEEVPLAAAPETGDNSIIYVLVSLISLAGAAVLILKRRTA